MPRAIAASLVVLALSAGVSFGFVIQRGGIDLPPSAHPSAAAAVASPSAAPHATAAPATAAPVATGKATPTPEVTVPPSEPPTVAPASDQPSAKPPPTAAPTPSASGGPSASRLAVLKPCTGQARCYVYTIRSGDNLFSIAAWFGVPLDTVYRWNPTVKTTGIHAGMQIKIPTPTR